MTNFPVQENVENERKCVLFILSQLPLLHRYDAKAVRLLNQTSGGRARNNNERKSVQMYKMKVTYVQNNTFTMHEIENVLGEYFMRRAGFLFYCNCHYFMRKYLWWGSGVSLFSHVGSDFAGRVVYRTLNSRSAEVSAAWLCAVTPSGLLSPLCVTSDQNLALPANAIT